MLPTMLTHHAGRGPEDSLGAPVPVSMQEIQDFIEELDLFFNNKRCAICSESIATHIDSKTISRCGCAFHEECLALWKFAQIFKKKPVHCPDCCRSIVLFSSK